MKKFFLLMACIPIFFISCFEYDGRTSRALVKALVKFPSDVAKIHVGIFDGAVLPENLLEKQTLNPGASLDLQVPPGNNRIIVIWAENAAGIANYFGSTPPMTIEEDTNPLIPIQMKKFSSETPPSFGLNHITGTDILIWNSIPGAVTYEIQKDDLGNQIYYTIAIVYGTSYNLGGYLQSNFRIRVSVSLFDLTSNWSVPHGY
jgi:hypothetical protein